MGAKDFAEKYMDLEPIPEFRLRDCERLAGKNIFQLSTSGIAICGSCGEHIQIHAKHKAAIECPNCKKKMTVQHVWRMSKKIDEFEWVTHSQRLDDKCVVIRFVKAERRPKIEDYTGENLPAIKGTPWHTMELARLYYHEDYAAPGIYQWWGCDKKWIKGGGGYFKPDTYSVMCRNPRWCLYAYQDTENAIKEFGELDCFKYYPLRDIWDNEKSIYQIFYLMRTARMNEKLTKLGLTEVLAAQESEYNNSDYYYSFYKGRAWLTGNKSLKETLKLDQLHYQMFIKHPSKQTLKILKDIKDITLEELDRWGSEIYNIQKLSQQVGVTRAKLTKYFDQQKKYLGHTLSTYEYSHYLNTLTHLKKIDVTDLTNFVESHPRLRAAEFDQYLDSIDFKYDVKDLHYSMPKNFRKEDTRLTKEYRANSEFIDPIWKQIRNIEKSLSVLDNLKEQAKIDETIYKISQIISNCKELRFWMNGSSGLKVLVPESVGELVDAGINLHNCLATYADAIADKNTLLFFIRKLNSPDEDYIAMEYQDGKRVQIRFDHNVEVKDEKILQFADAFVAELNKIKIMKKVRKVA